MICQGKYIVLLWRSSRASCQLLASSEHNETSTSTLHWLWVVSMDVNERNKLVQAVQAGERRYRTLIRQA